MTEKAGHYSADFEKALQVGRPTQRSQLFPNSKALLVSGKVIDRAMMAKGKAMTVRLTAEIILSSVAFWLLRRGPTRLY